MKIWNFTGRSLNFYDQLDTYLSYDKFYLKNFCAPALVIESHGTTPEVFSEFDDLKVGNITLPVQRFVGAEAIYDFCPDYDEDEDVIVAPSIWVQTARILKVAPAHARLATVYGLVYTREQRFKAVGCIGLESK